MVLIFIVCKIHRNNERKENINFKQISFLIAFRWDEAVRPTRSSNLAAEDGRRSARSLTHTRIPIGRVWNDCMSVRKREREITPLMSPSAKQFLLWQVDFDCEPDCLLLRLVGWRSTQTYSSYCLYNSLPTPISSPCLILNYYSRPYIFS